MRMDARRLPQRLILGKLDGAKKRGWGGKEKEWVNCVEKDVRAFGIERLGDAVTAGRCMVQYRSRGGAEVYGHIEEDRRTSV